MNIDEAFNKVESQMDDNRFQILITNISWNKNTIGQYRSKHDNYEDLPAQFALDVPENKMNEANKKQNVFNDVIESYAYDFLTRKFGHEVYHCQIWLPLDK